jgi:hypothetical protein
VRPVVGADVKAILIDAFCIDLAAARADLFEALEDVATWRAMAKQGIEELATLTKRCQQLERRIADLREAQRAEREAA